MASRKSGKKHSFNAEQPAFHGELCCFSASSPMPALLSLWSLTSLCPSWNLIHFLQFPTTSPPTLLAALLSSCEEVPHLSTFLTLPCWPCEISQGHSAKDMAVPTSWLCFLIYWQNMPIENALGVCTEIKACGFIAKLTQCEQKGSQCPRQNKLNALSQKIISTLPLYFSSLSEAMKAYRYWGKKLNLLRSSKLE